MKLSSDHVIEVKLSWAFGTILSLFASVIGGTAWTVNLQNDIRRRLDENVTHREFMLWQEQLRRDNATMHIPNMGTFRSGWIAPMRDEQTVRY